MLLSGHRYVIESDMEKERSLRTFHSNSKELQGSETKVMPDKVLLKYTPRKEQGSQER